MSKPRAAATAAAIAAAATALWVEHRSRRAERLYRAPHNFIYIDGTRLHYQMVGEGPPVLLIHGNLVHGADFEASGLLERLSREHKVLVIDRPGFGYSDRPRGVAWTAEAQARLLHRAAAALGMHGAVVVGHSLGTQIAVEMALQQPGDVAGLVLIGGYYWPSVRLDRWMAAPAAVPVLGDVMRYTVSGLTSRAMLGPSVRTMFAPRPVPDAFARAMPRDLLLRPLQQRSTVEDGSRMTAEAHALRDHYRKLRLPVTLIAGAQDRVVNPQAQSGRLHDALPHSGLHLVAGAGHMAHYEAQELIAAAVKTREPLLHARQVTPREAPETATNVLPLRPEVNGSVG